MASENDKTTPGDARPQSDLPDHERIDALLPWVRRGELDAADRAVMSEDMARSPEFRAKLAQDKDLAAALEAVGDEEEAESAQDADAAWKRFQERLEPRASAASSAARAAPDLARQRPASKTRTSAWRGVGLPRTGLGWFAAAQTAALAALCFVFLPPQLAQDDPEYRLLSSGEPTASVPVGNAVVMFDPTISEGDMRETLALARARIIDGPMANGGYVIVFDENALEAGLAALRASKSVALVEPLTAPRDEP